MNQQNLGSHLFERIPSQEYLRERTEALMHETSPQSITNSQSVLIFCLGKELLAIPIAYLKEVANMRKIHRIPHRSSKILQGLVNLNGELQLCISLHSLLEIAPALHPVSGKKGDHHERMVALVKEGDLWVFQADEIKGIFNFDLSEMENVPVTITKSPVNFIKGIMKWEGKSVGLIDEELLFASLKRSIT